MGAHATHSHVLPTIFVWTALLMHLSHRLSVGSKIHLNEARELRLDPKNCDSMSWASMFWFIVLTSLLLEKAGAALQWPMIRATALGLGALIFASTHEAGH